jgi:hypothetical protein
MGIIRIKEKYIILKNNKHPINLRLKIKQNCNSIHCRSTSGDNNNIISNNKKGFINFKLVIIYNNAETNRSTILTTVKRKAKISQWTYKETGKFYIDSAFELDKRLKDYYRIFFICSRNKGNSYIYNTILSRSMVIQILVLQLLNILILVIY